MLEVQGVHQCLENEAFPRSSLTREEDHKGAFKVLWLAVMGAHHLNHLPLLVRKLA